MSDDEETWRMREGELTFEFQPMAGDYLVFYYDSALGQDPGISSEHIHKSWWKYLKSALVD